MDNLIFMQDLQPMKQLEGNLPDKSFLKAFPMVLLEPRIDLAFEIAAIGVLHDHAQALVLVVEERALIADHVWNVN